MNKHLLSNIWLIHPPSSTYFCLATWCIRVCVWVILCVCLRLSTHSVYSQCSISIWNSSETSTEVWQKVNRIAAEKSIPPLLSQPSCLINVFSARAKGECWYQRSGRRWTKSATYWKGTRVKFQITFRWMLTTCHLYTTYITVLYCKALPHHVDWAHATQNPGQQSFLKIIIIRYHIFSWAKISGTVFTHWFCPTW